jgi:hypothetical protein
VNTKQIVEDVTTATEFRLGQLIQERVTVSAPIAIAASEELQRRHDRYVGRYDNQTETIKTLRLELHGLAVVNQSASAEIAGLREALEGMREARDMHGANCATLMQEIRALKGEAN